MYGSNGKVRFAVVFCGRWSRGRCLVGVQGYGLWYLKENQDPARVVTGSNAFIFVFAFLHAMHFIVALLFLVFVTLQGLADRYDHEYYWG